ncbi:MULTISPECIES: UDP-N-acetylmuramate dehydrogenase [Vibrio]|uniref:UDP-N-acetylmuramate dehydrogenase n=1 Tax=Vibrio TaxID=662 RepID=UPI00215EE7BB|nr:MULTISPECIES: UDP-N-acetylmuramate dehydrogenase [Vibrio]MCS0137827.1 UDP-N-acetylmuramate dehydrogenase [Vibrio alginolyticus]MCS0198918.1 UDP-N-acetylmuramate dehydrogenase [Vibrio alginolyticus]MDW2148237.1 UDP-N-acetylmuramate dehydrogenase [Vibrio sp. 378]
MRIFSLKMNIKENVSLSSFSHWKIGGKAKYLSIVNNEKEILEAIEFAKVRNLPWLVVGNTSNLLFSDSGFDGVLIKLDGKFKDISLSNDGVVNIGSACFTPTTVRKLIAKGFSGLEHLIGIPASFGGVIYMNAGSQRKSISSNILSVLSIDESGNIIERRVDKCAFDYRESCYQSLNEIILSCKLKLQPGCKIELRRKCLEILKERRMKFPRKEPSCGSVFVSNPKMYETIGPPGKVIEDVGLKGYKFGGAQISAMHANFIVNRGKASAIDVLTLIKLAYNEVYQKTGFRLKSEAIYITRSGEQYRADIVANNLKRFVEL